MKIFDEIYENNLWLSDESVSGTGSTMDATAAIRMLIPQIVKELGVKTILDIPCGDYKWFQTMNLDVRYTGADVVRQLVTDDYEKYGDEDHTFRVLDITKDPLPQVDLVLCRDLLGHFSNRDVQLALKNLKKSGSKYLLATTFPERENATDIVTGQWRPINLASMFGLPDPKAYLYEGCTALGFEDKALGLWEL
jgi:hypothetical protein